MDCKLISNGGFIAGGVEWRRGHEGREVTRGGDERRRVKNEFEELTLYYSMVEDRGRWLMWMKCEDTHYQWMLFDGNLLRKLDENKLRQ